jgi:uncharacterized protein
MIQATFCHAQGLGLTTEQRLWEAGILSWEAALQTASTLPLSDVKKRQLFPVLEASQLALERQDSRWFQKNFPSAALWRGAKAFEESIAYVDIETDGGYEASSVTVIGLFDGFETKLYVKGQNLEDFVTDIKDYKLLVTFFGTGFDLPFLRRRFPELALDQLHIDLCPALRRLGQTGGLKAIEHRLGIQREDTVEGMSGMDAVYLWALWERRRDEAALERLLAYNRADIENLKLLLEWAYPKLVAQSGFPQPPG